MFTGIVESVGRIAAFHPGEGGAKLLITVPEAWKNELNRGASVAVNGVCLTLVGWQAVERRKIDQQGTARQKIDQQRDAGPEEHPAATTKTATVEAVPVEAMVFDVAPETLARSNLGRGNLADQDLRRQPRVNLERAMPASGRFDGHIVQGHIDGSTTLLAKEAQGESLLFRLAMREAWQAFMVPKGSVAVNGVSLTLIDVEPSFFSFMLIPHTQQETNLVDCPSGGMLNIELDILAKYVHRRHVPT